MKSKRTVVIVIVLAVMILVAAALVYTLLLMPASGPAAHDFLATYYTVSDTSAAATVKTDEELANLLEPFEKYATKELIEVMAQNRLAGAPVLAAAQAGCRLSVSEVRLENMGETENRVQYRYIVEAQAVFADGVSKACLFAGELETEKAGGERRVCSFAPDVWGAEEMAAVLD